MISSVKAFLYLQISALSLQIISEHSPAVLVFVAIDTEVFPV